MKSRLWLLLFCFLLLPTCNNVHASDHLGLAVTDLIGSAPLEKEFGAFRDRLSRLARVDIRLCPVHSRMEAVRALNSGRVDLVLTGPAEYVVFRKKTESQPLVVFSRPDYFAGIVVMAESGISTIADLKGKKVAFGAVGSTSNHLAPMQILADHGLDPRRDIKSMHVEDVDQSWAALIRGDIAALGMNYQVFQRKRSKEETLEPGAFRVIGRGPDLPNDVMLAGSHVDGNLLARLRHCFETHPRELIEAVLVGEDNAKYQGMKFLTRVSDSEYGYVRRMYATVGFPAYADFIGQ